MSQNKAQRDKAYAAYMRSKGIFHGKRQSKPYPNSGGLTMTSGPGSAAYQRRPASKKG